MCIPGDRGVAIQNSMGVIPIEGEEAQAPAPEPSPFAEAPPDMVNSRIIDPNDPRERTSYSDRNTPRDENKSKLQAKPKEEVPPPKQRTGRGFIGLSGLDPLAKNTVAGKSGVNI